jgi:hypothetical protein
MNTMPIIEIRLEGMRHTLRAAILEHMAGMDEIVQREIDRVCTPENVASIVAKAADDEIKRAITDEISNFYRYGVGRECIAAVVRKTLEDRTSGS